MNWLLVAIGGALGAMARYGANQGALLLGLPVFWATLTVNVAGSFVFGALGSLLAGGGAWRVLLTVGFLGAFTTFSAFAGEAAEIWRQGRWGMLALHLLLHNGLSLAAVFAGAFAASGLKA